LHLFARHPDHNRKKPETIPFRHQCHQEKTQQRKTPNGHTGRVLQLHGNQRRQHPKLFKIKAVAEALEATNLEYTRAVTTIQSRPHRVTNPSKTYDEHKVLGFAGEVPFLVESVKRKAV
jgi:hypothetical protein